MVWKPLGKDCVVIVPSVLTDGEQIRIGEYSYNTNSWIVEGWIGEVKPTHYMTIPHLPKSAKKVLVEEYKKQHDVIRDEFEKLAIRQGELIDQKTKLLDEVDKVFPQREGNRRVRDHILFDVPLD